MALNTNMMDRRTNLDAMRASVEKMKEQGLIRTPGTGPITINGVAVKGIRTEIVKVNPALAAEWLGRNTKNRRLRQTVVEAFARDMKAGNWTLTHQGIAFGESGRLLDGQHRLNAVVLAGVEVEMMVTVGMPEKVKGKNLATMDAVDRGGVRSVADQMSVQHGISDAALMTAIATVLGNICFNGHKLGRITVAQTLEILDVFGEDAVWAVKGSSTVKVLRSAPVLAAVAFARPHAPAKVKDFLEKFNSGAGLDETSPVLHLRNILMSGAVNTHGSAGDRKTVSARVLLAVKWFLEGKKTDKLPAIDEGRDYFIGQRKAAVEQARAIFKFK